MYINTLASQYSHNTVLIGILPDNDFLNDNIVFDSIQSPLRYKPYWNDSLNVKYYVNDLQLNRNLITKHLKNINQLLSIAERHFFREYDLLV